jgi:pSer/pThr/pTyr-binding forkhead associated (FHA) protein
MNVHLTVVQGRPQGKTIPVAGTRFLIGRGEACQLRPNSELVSREHAELLVRADGVLLHDLGSRNGTWVNGTALTGPARLRDGDRVQVGTLVFAVSIRGRAGAAMPPASETPAASDDEISSWLIADDNRPIPGRLSGVYAGRTLKIAALDEEAADPGLPPVPPVPRSSSDAADAILRKLTERRQRDGRPADRPR